MAIDGNHAHFASHDDATSPCGYRHYLELLQRNRPDLHADDAAHELWARDVLQAFNRFQLLFALRHGPHGVEGLNQFLADALQASGLNDPRPHETTEVGER